MILEVNRRAYFVDTEKIPKPRNSFNPFDEPGVEIKVTRHTGILRWLSDEHYTYGGAGGGGYISSCLSAYLELEDGSIVQRRLTDLCFECAQEFVNHDTTDAAKAVPVMHTNCMVPTSITGDLASSSGSPDVIKKGVDFGGKPC